MELRGYQKKALYEANCWFNKETGYPLIVLPTGAGKTVVFASLIKQLYEEDFIRAATEDRERTSLQLVPTANSLQVM